MLFDFETGHPGLWVNRECPNGAGIHALIIGVSRYDHLSEGASQGSETYGLGQLSASALTAYRFFEWLINGYALSDLPVARVRLLLSPLRACVGEFAADELAGCDPKILAHVPEANFNICKSALENWYADMEALQAPAIGRSLFFFSGHGIERRHKKQILLPSDYMAPPGRLMNNALSTPNIVDSLPYLRQVDSHVLLLDGCRDDIDKLRGAQGASILNEEPAHKPNPLFQKGALSATAFGLRAYSPKDGKLSLFGQALLEGLRNKPDPALGEAPIELIRKGIVSTIEINKLGSYMNRRVDALIKAANESVVQIVRSEVESFDPGRAIEMAELPHSDESRLPPRIDLDDLVMGDISDGIEPTGSFGNGIVWRVEHDTVDAPESWFQHRYGSLQDAFLARPHSDPAMHYHDIFGSEAITYPWVQSMRLIGLSTGHVGHHEAVEILSSAQAEKTNDLHRVQVHFRLRTPDPVGNILTIKNFRGRRFGCILPSDVERRVFQLEIDAQNDDYIRFAAFLSPLNEGTTGNIAKSWEEMRALDPLAASRRIVSSGVSVQLDRAFRDGNVALRFKVRAPLGAAVASVLLLKGNQFNLMHDWARNVGNWFSDIPDGVVVWTEQRRRMMAGKPLSARLISWFVQELSTRSLPFMADSFGIATDLLTDISRGRIQCSDAARKKANLLLERYELAALFFRDGGMFSSFVDWPDDADIARIVGQPRSSG